jgi:hypothetical protein
MEAENIGDFCSLPMICMRSRLHGLAQFLEPAQSQRPEVSYASRPHATPIQISEHKERPVLISQSVSRCFVLKI